MSASRSAPCPQKKARAKNNEGHFLESRMDSISSPDSEGEMISETVDNTPATRTLNKQTQLIRDRREPDSNGGAFERTVSGESDQSSIANESVSQNAASSSFEEDSSTNSGNHKRRSVWSPVKHVIAVDTESVLKTEGAPAWKPLRKSKARQSFCFNTENVKSVPSTEGCAIDFMHASSITSKQCQESRTPLKSMTPVHLNQPPVKTVSFEDSASTNLSNQQGNSSLDSPLVANTSKCGDEQQPTASDFKAENLSSTDESILPSPPKNLVEVNPEVPLPALSSSEPLHASEDRGNMDLKNPLGHLKGISSPVRFSPILLQAYGEEVAKVRGSIGSPEKVVNLDENKSSVEASKVLKGVVAYVEVRRGEDDRTGGFRWKLKELGASLSDTLNKKVTHVVFQEGLLSTYRKAKELNIHLVSAHWVMACDESLTKIDEKSYPIEKLDQYDLADPLTKYIKRPKIMSPDLGSGRDDKRLSKRFQRINRRSHLADGPLSVKTQANTKDALTRRIPMLVASESPKRNVDTSLEEDDDDGFLAMVQAQVREKASSRLKKEEVEKAVKDFEIQIQALLGHKAEGNGNEEDSIPLARIFQLDKSSPIAVTKASNKRNSKRKLENKPVSSTSIMMKWLLKKTPNTNVNDGDDSTILTAEAAADAISNEILKSMRALATNAYDGDDSTFQTSNAAADATSNEVSASTSVQPFSDKYATTSQAHSSKAAKLSKKLSSNQLRNLTADQVTSKATSDSHKPTKSHSKRQVKRSRNDPKESKASSGLMRNWLAGAHSSTVVSSDRQIKPEVFETPKKKRKMDDELIVLDDDSDLEQRKEVTNEDMFGTILTTSQRRRSARLTPVKHKSDLYKASELDIVQEGVEDEKGEAVSKVRKPDKTNPSKQKKKSHKREVVKVSITKTSQKKTFCGNAGVEPSDGESFLSSTEHPDAISPAESLGELVIETPATSAEADIVQDGVENEKGENVSKVKKPNKRITLKQKKRLQKKEGLKVSISKTSQKITLWGNAGVEPADSESFLSSTEHPDAISPAESLGELINETPATSAEVDIVQDGVENEKGETVSKVKKRNKTKTSKQKKRSQKKEVVKVSISKTSQKKTFCENAGVVPFDGESSSRSSIEHTDAINIAESSHELVNKTPVTSADPKITELEFKASHVSEVADSDPNQFANTLRMILKSKLSSKNDANIVDLEYVALHASGSQDESIISAARKSVEFVENRPVFSEGHTLPDSDMEASHAPKACSEFPRNVPLSPEEPKLRNDCGDFDHNCSSTSASLVESVGNEPRYFDDHAKPIIIDSKITETSRVSNSGVISAGNSIQLPQNDGLILDYDEMPDAGVKALHAPKTSIKIVGDVQPSSSILSGISHDSAIITAEKSISVVPRAPSNSENADWKEKVSHTAETSSKLENKSASPSECLAPDIDMEVSNVRGILTDGAIISAEDSIPHVQNNPSSSESPDMPDVKMETSHKTETFREVVKNEPSSPSECSMPDLEMEVSRISNHSAIITAEKSISVVHRAPSSSENPDWKEKVSHTAETFSKLENKSASPSECLAPDIDMEVSNVSGTLIDSAIISAEDSIPHVQNNPSSSESPDNTETLREVVKNEPSSPSDCSMPDLEMEVSRIPNHSAIITAEKSISVVHKAPSSSENPDWKEKVSHTAETFSKLENKCASPSECLAPDIDMEVSNVSGTLIDNAIISADDSIQLIQNEPLGCKNRLNS